MLNKEMLLNSTKKDSAFIRYPDGTYNRKPYWDDPSGRIYFRTISYINDRWGPTTVVYFGFLGKRTEERKYILACKETGTEMELMDYGIGVGSSLSMGEEYSDVFDIESRQNRTFIFNPPPPDGYL